MGLGSRSKFIGFTRTKRIKVTSERAQSRCCHHRVDHNLWKDCAGCQGAQGLRNERRLAAVMNVLSREWATDGIVLSRDSDILHSSNCVEILSGLAKLVRFCEDLSASSPGLRRRTSFGACGVCSELLESIVEQVRKDLGTIRRTVTRVVFRATEGDGNPTTCAQT